MDKKVRVRFAPSPTGFLHIGGARTALYNWLFAKHNNGTFILRIEDTDEVRSTEESVGQILNGLKWLGLDWDEGPTGDGFKGDDETLSQRDAKGNFGPYYQYTRYKLKIYRKYADELISKGKAYYCYCTQEELEKKRKQALSEKRSPKHSCDCKNLSDVQKKEKKIKPVVRFNAEGQGDINIKDGVKGEVSFKMELMEDFIILKASGVPTYNFACVVDDHEMQITHVIRGDDHLSNTPRQKAVYDVFGWQSPEFAHISMILGSDGSRLSKRHGATSLDDYRKAGYLPETMVNYLALLGWSTEDSQQLFTMEELVNKFSLERCSKSPAIFDDQKLMWMNGEYLKNKDAKELLPLIKGYMPEEYKGKINDDYLTRIVEAYKIRIKLLPEFWAANLTDFFFKDDFIYDEKGKSKHLGKPENIENLKVFAERLEKLAKFTHSEIEKICREVAEEKGLKASKIIHPTRMAISGKTSGAGLFEMMEILGKERVIKRMTDAD